MKQNPRDRAIAEMAELREKLGKLEAFVEVYDELQAEDEDETVHLDVPLVAESKQLGQCVTLSAETPFASKEQIWDAVRDILRDETEPMHISYLYKLVTARGLRITGQNPKGNLSAKLAPLDDVIYVKDRGWVLRANMNRALMNGSPNGNGSDRESLPSPETSNPAYRGA